MNSPDKTGKFTVTRMVQEVSESYSMHLYFYVDVLSVPHAIESACCSCACDKQ